MKKFFISFAVSVLALGLVLAGCSSPVGGLKINDLIDYYTGDEDANEIPHFPDGFEDYILGRLADGSLATKSVDFNSLGPLTGYEQMEVTKTGYFGYILEGQWLPGEWKNGEWITGGQYVNGEWKIGIKEENVIVAAGAYEGSQTIKYQGGQTYKKYNLSNNMGSFNLTDKGNGSSGTKNIWFQLNLTDPVDKVVTVEIYAPNTNKTYTYHGLYHVGGLIGEAVSIPVFNVVADEDGIQFSIKVESWDGTWSCIETEDGERLFVVNDLVYAFDGKTINGNDYYEYNADTIYELGIGENLIFVASDETYYMAEDNFLEKSDTEIFVFNTGMDMIFYSADGYYWEGSGLDFVDLGSSIIVLDSESPFIPMEGGTDEYTWEVDDPDKPIYALITEKSFDLEIEFEESAVIIGQGSLVYDAMETVAINYDLDPIFSLLLAALDDVQLACNGEEVIDNAVMLAYEKNTDLSFALEFTYTAEAEEIIDGE